MQSCHCHRRRRRHQLFRARAAGKTEGPRAVLLHLPPDKASPRAAFLLETDEVAAAAAAALMTERRKTPPRRLRHLLRKARGGLSERRPHRGQKKPTNPYCGRSSQRRIAYGGSRCESFRSIPGQRPPLGPPVLRPRIRRWPVAERTRRSNEPAPRGRREHTMEETRMHGRERRDREPKGMVRVCRWRDCGPSGARRCFSWPGNLALW